MTNDKLPISTKKLLADYKRMLKRNVKLEHQAAHLKQENKRLSKLKKGELVVRGLVGKKMRTQTGDALPKYVYVPTELKMPGGGVLVVATVGNAKWDASVEDVETVVETLVTAMEETLPKDHPFAVVGLAHGVKVDAYLVSGSK